MPGTFAGSDGQVTRLASPTVAAGSGVCIVIAYF